MGLFDNDNDGNALYTNTSGQNSAGDNPNSNTPSSAVSSPDGGHPPLFNTLTPTQQLMAVKIGLVSNDTSQTTQQANADIGSTMSGPPPSGNKQPQEQPEIRKLTDYERRMMKEAGFTDEQLDPITLHIGGGHESMPKDMDAITYGDKIYLRDGIHDPNSARGLAFLAHEIQHSHQWRTGMTYAGYAFNSLGGYRNNKYEKDASNCEADAYHLIKERRLRDVYEQNK